MDQDDTSQFESIQKQEAPSMRMPKRWPLVTQPANRSASFLKDARLVNCYAERTEKGYEVEKRFGIGPVAWSPTAGVGQGMCNYRTSSYVSCPYFCVNGTLYYITTFMGNPVMLTIGTVVTTGGSSQLKWCLVPAPSPYLVFGAGGTHTYYSNGFGTLTQITDPNFPATTVPGIVALDGTTYVMDTSSNIWGSAGLNNPTVWSALNVIQANSEGDIPIALAKQLVYVIAFKSTSIQIFYDAGNATGSPLSPLPGALIKYGCVDANTLQDIDGVLLWVTNDKNNISQVGMLENLQFKVVSTPAIDRFLAVNTLAVTGQVAYNFLSFTFKAAGHSFYVLTNVTNGITLVYDLREKLWYQWTSETPTPGSVFRACSIATDQSNNFLVQDYLTGALNYFGPDYQYPTDNGTLIPVDIYTPNFDADVDRIKYLSQMRFNADQTKGSKLYVRYSDNDYGSWSNFRQVDLGQVRPFLNDEGSFYRRAYHFSHQAPTPLRIRSVDLQMDIGTL